jgi:hypothetical protein
MALSFSTRSSETLLNIETGIVTDHGYGLLAIRENLTNTGFTLIKYSGEWNGDLYDSSLIWDLYPQVKAELKFEAEDNGIFLIADYDLHGEQLKCLINKSVKIINYFKFILNKLIHKI